MSCMDAYFRGIVIIVSIGRLDTNGELKAGGYQSVAVSAGSYHCCSLFIRRSLLKLLLFRFI